MWWGRNNRIGGFIQTRTLATHLILGMRRLWRASFIHSSRVRPQTIALGWRWVIWVMRDRPQWLPMRAVDQWLSLWRVRVLGHSARVPKMRIGCVCRHKCMRLGRYRCEDALLVKADAVRAAPINGRVEAMAPNLLSGQSSELHQHMLHSPCAFCSTYRQSQCAALVLAG